MRGCPAPQIPPSDGIATTVRGVAPATKYSPHTADLSIIETTATIRRIVLAFAGRGIAPASDQSSFLRPYVGHLNKSGLAVVTMAGGESYWHPRRGGEDRLDMLLETVIPWLRKEYGYHVKMGAIGWSMGGFGALNLATLHPEIIDRVCGVSPALWQDASQQASAVPDAFDDAADYNKYDVYAHAAALKHTQVRIVCGSHDPFYTNAIAYSKTLEARAFVANNDVERPRVRGKLIALSARPGPQMPRERQMRTRAARHTRSDRLRGTHERRLL